MDIGDLLNENPSLRPSLTDTLERAYLKDRLLAADNTGQDESLFPTTCPFTLEQALDEAYWPG